MRWLIFLVCSLATATTYTATSCSNANIQTAVNMATDGDTVVVGTGGTVTWSGNITLNNGVTLNGAGCTISGNGGTINITLDSVASTRVTGFTTTGAYGGPPYFISATGSPTTKYLRIDHNTFADTTTGDTWITIAGNPLSLIDHNTFNSGGQAAEEIHNFGYGAGSQTGWTDNVTPGSPYQMYIEANTFTNNDSGPTSDKIIESYYGSQTVVRYNTFNGNLAVDQHGSVSSVSARWWEFYQNTWAPGGGNLTGYAALRGGSGVFYSNHQTGTFGAGTPGVAMYDDNSSTYPICYQPGRGIQSSGDACASTPGGTTTTELLSPIYLWGNDSALTTAIAGSGTTVEAGRDFYCWSGSAWGSTCSNTSVPSSLVLTSCETTSSSGTLSSCSSTITYVAFTYPYPLDSNNIPCPTGCSATSPTVTTTTATGITATGASAGGVVTSNGGASITSEGTCYATTMNPTTPCTSDGTATPFTSTLSGLMAGTLYYYRAFATNSVGTSYGSDLNFTTSSLPTGSVGAGNSVSSGASVRP
jgi:hypothetical protein